MAGNQELLAAFQMFGQSVKEAQFTRAVNDANQMVQDIKSSGLEENEQRKAINQLSQNLAHQVLPMVGAKEAAITQSLFFQEPEKREESKTVQEAFVRGSKSERKGAEDFLTFKSTLDKKKDKEAQLKPIAPAELRVLNDIDNQKDAGMNIKNKIDADKWLVGPGAGRVPGREQVDPDFAGFKADVQRLFDAYRKALTGAQASDKELERLEKSFPKVTDRPKTFKSKLNSIISMSDRIKKRYISNLEKAGRDVGGFLKKKQQQAPQTPSLQQIVDPEIPGLTF